MEYADRPCRDSVPYQGRNAHTESEPEQVYEEGAEVHDTSQRPVTRSTAWVIAPTEAPRSEAESLESEAFGFAHGRGRDSDAHEPAILYEQEAQPSPESRRSAPQRKAESAVASVGDPPYMGSDVSEPRCEGGRWGAVTRCFNPRQFGARTRRVGHCS